MVRRKFNVNINLQREKTVVIPQIRHLHHSKTKKGGENKDTLIQVIYSKRSLTFRKTGKLQRPTTFFS